MQDIPLVSCIMLAGRVAPQDLDAAIDDFKKQTYANKELIIVNNAKTQFAAAGLNVKAQKDIFLIDTPSELTAGMARNHGIRAANGQILAQFDADHYHAPDRLMTQIMALAKENAQICLLQDCHSYSHASGFLRRYKNERNMIPSTLICARPAKIDYPNLDKSEEYGFLERLLNAGMRAITIEEPHLCCKLYQTPGTRSRSVKGGDDVTSESLNEFRKRLRPRVVVARS